MSIRDDVLATVALMAAEPDADDDVCIALLIERGYSRLQALLLVLLIPLAFGRAIIATQPRMPKMPDPAAIPADGRVYYVRLTAIPEFAEATAAVADGIIPPDQVWFVGARGSELRALQGAVEEGHDLSKSRVSAPYLLGLADVPGFVEWFETFGPEDRDVELV